ncbi:MAG TPA: UDP-N-acetylglucosamine 2-epimerase (non-hydrolyzing) [Dehalococcoidia bacterium]|nr:UDP-N-acetylglucosamine 2-epimerase (non-hydrolyzing) [Dehalococcoidia bacterium]|tara:strand:+ start:3865 stop:4989 length:1125 start_codon:yes stop_codon:yes gene_type:complete
MSVFKKFLHIVGARPNFIKVGPLIKSLDEKILPGNQLLLHTGQHFDNNMSDVFFNELELPKPDINLNVSTGNPILQLSEMISGLSDTLTNFKPDCIIVYGDTNSALAGALAGTKLSIPVAHVEAGLRSNDKNMPEEINRIITDNISEFLFTPSKDADKNLARENISANKIFFVGNIMIDTLINSMPKINNSSVLEKLGLINNHVSHIQPYTVLTLHRPTNVDNYQLLKHLLESVTSVPDISPIVFPVHPRATHLVNTICKNIDSKRLICIEPLGYLDFLKLIKESSLVITDSGGIQEETTYLQTPCITLRTTTERPITITEGTNELINPESLNLADLLKISIPNLKNKPSTIPELWDGKTGSRIAHILTAQYDN